jgi:hypothetical protein
VESLAGREAVPGANFRYELVQFEGESLYRRRRFLYLSVVPAPSPIRTTLQTLTERVFLIFQLLKVGLFCDGTSA